MRTRRLLASMAAAAALLAACGNDDASTSSASTAAPTTESSSDGGNSTGDGNVAAPTEGVTNDVVDFVATDVFGTEVNVGELAAKKDVVVWFWAPW